MQVSPGRYGPNVDTRLFWEDIPFGLCILKNLAGESQSYLWFSSISRNIHRENAAQCLQTRHAYAAHKTPYQFVTRKNYFREGHVALLPSSASWVRGFGRIHLSCPTHANRGIDSVWCDRYVLVSRSFFPFLSLFLPFFIFSFKKKNFCSLFFLSFSLT